MSREAGDERDAPYTLLDAEARCAGWPGVYDLLSGASRQGKQGIVMRGAVGIDYSGMRWPFSKGVVVHGGAVLFGLIDLSREASRIVQDESGRDQARSRRRGSGGAARWSTGSGDGRQVRAPNGEVMLGILLRCLRVPRCGAWIRFNAPLLEGLDEPVARLASFSPKCAALAVLFTLVLGIEEVAHERLVSPAFDPLAGHETRRMPGQPAHMQRLTPELTGGVRRRSARAGNQHGGRQPDARGAGSTVVLGSRSLGFLAGFITLSSTGAAFARRRCCSARSWLRLRRLARRFRHRRHNGGRAVLVAFLLSRAVVLVDRTPPQAEL